MISLSVNCSLTFIGTLSSQTQRRFPLYQDKRRAEIEMVFYIVVCWSSLSFCLILATFRL